MANAMDEDTRASQGMKIGPGGKKSVEGSMAMLLIQFVCIHPDCFVSKLACGFSGS